MIKIRDVSKYYGSLCALNSLNISIPMNQVTAIVGENGSGKSTLLDIVSRLQKSDSGSIYVNDQSIDDYTTQEFAKKLATLKQSNHFNLRIRVKELVSFGRYPYNQRSLSETDKEIVENAMEIMQCSDLMNRYIDTLSGGQLQRACIAMILAQDTDIILLDEPLNNLDLKHAHELMIIIRKYAHDYHKTIVIIMHDVNMVYQYCDYVVALKEGSVVCDGPVTTTLDIENLFNIYGLNFSIINNQKHCLAFVE